MGLVASVLLYEGSRQDGAGEVAGVGLVTAGVLVDSWWRIGEYLERNGNFLAGAGSKQSPLIGFGSTYPTFIVRGTTLV